MNKPYLFLFDIDGTLCELRETATPYNHSGEEIPIHSTTVLLQAILYSFQKMGTANNFRVGIITGRKEKEYREVTKKWFDYFMPEVFKYQFLEFHMQQGSTAKKNHIYKEEKIQQLQEKYDVIGLVDDNPDLGPVCKKLGIPFYLFSNN